MPTPQTPDGEYEFTLTLSGVSELTPAVEDALFEAGCDDATLSLRGGRVYLTFSRVAASLDEAVRSATRDVRAAGVGADVELVPGDHLHPAGPTR